MMSSILFWLDAYVQSEEDDVAQPDTTKPSSIKQQS